MRTPATEARNGGVGSAAKDVADRASAIARLELRLALLELRQKAVRLGAGVALVAVAAVFGLFLLAFCLAAAAAAWTLILPVWAALLVMGGAVMLVAAVLGGVGAALLRRGAPVPEQAIEEAKKTTEAIRAG